MSKNPVFELSRHVERQLEAAGVRTGEAVTLGVSGGADSVCLAHLLHLAAPSLSLRLHMVYVEHGLRGPESVQDAVFVHGLAQKWDIPATVCEVPVGRLARERGLSVQAAARQARYEALGRVAERIGSRWVAVAHTADDQAETFLLRLIRGAGTQGLSSMRLKRRGATESGYRFFVIRPLLKVTRSEVLGYLQAVGLPFREDASNQKPDYLRNRLRREVIPPLVSGYNPNLIRVLSRSAALLADDEAFLEQAAEEALKAVVLEREVDGVLLDREGIVRLHRALARRLLRSAVEQVGGQPRALRSAHTEAAMTLIGGGSTGQSLDFPGGVRLCLRYRGVWIGREQPGRETGGRIWPVQIPGLTRIEELGFEIEATTDPKQAASWDRNRIVLDYDRIEPPVVVRTRRPGDWFCPVGMRGGKKLQDYFVDEKIPRHDRDRVGILADRSGILWVIGRRADRRYVAHAGSRNIICIESRATGA